MAILSGRMAGHRGSLTYVANAGDPARELSDHDIFDWRLSMRRRMVDITEVNQSVKEWWYTHAEAVVEFKAYINQGENGTNYHPGAFNQTEPATVTLWPDGDEFNKRWTMEGWLEDMRIEVSIGTPNILLGKIRVFGDIGLTWF